MTEIDERQPETSPQEASSEVYLGPEQLEARINEAKEVCEIQATPEVAEAIEGYYIRSRT